MREKRMLAEVVINGEENEVKNLIGKERGIFDRAWEALKDSGRSLADSRRLAMLLMAFSLSSEACLMPERQPSNHHKQSTPEENVLKDLELTPDMKKLQSELVDLEKKGWTVIFDGVTVEVRMGGKSRNYQDFEDYISSTYSDDDGAARRVDVLSEDVAESYLQMCIGNKKNGQFTYSMSVLKEARTPLEALENGEDKDFLKYTKDERKKNLILPSQQLVVEVVGGQVKIRLVNWITGKMVYEDILPFEIDPGFRMKREEPLERAAGIEDEFPHKESHKDGGTWDVGEGMVKYRNIEESMILSDRLAEVYVAKLRAILVADTKKTLDTYEAVREVAGLPKIEVLPIGDFLPGNGVEILKKINRFIQIDISLLPNQNKEEGQRDFGLHHDQLAVYDFGTPRVIGTIDSLGFTVMDFKNTDWRPGIVNDKYGNLVSTSTHKYKDSEGEEKVMLFLKVYPPKPLGKAVSGQEPLPVYVDLSFLGIEQSEPLFYQEAIPESYKVKSNGGAEYSVYGTVSLEKMERYKNKIQVMTNGAAWAEEMFGFVPGSMVKNIVVLSTDRNNAYFSFSDESSIMVTEESLEELDRLEHLYGEERLKNDKFITGSHETIHLIDHRLKFSQDEEWLRRFWELKNKAFCRPKENFFSLLDEDRWFGLKQGAGHSEDDEGEFLASFVDSLKMPSKHLTDYAETADALGRVVKRRLKDNLKVPNIFAQILESTGKNYY